MAIHYVIDGYNIIKQSADLANKKLEEGRECLIQLIENQKPQGSSKNTVTIVFDGQSGMGFGECRHRPDMNVVFSSNESADEKIKKMVAESAHKKSLVIVTDDRAIQYYVKALGARINSVESFLKKTRMTANRAKTKSAGKKESRKKIPLPVENKITSELEKIWLKKKK